MEHAFECYNSKAVFTKASQVQSAYHKLYPPITAVQLWRVSTTLLLIN